MNKPTIYLAGAIRDGHPEDIEWRENIIEGLRGLATFINPLGGKKHDKKKGGWTVSGIPSTGKLIVKQDFWSVDRSDILIFNFTGLATSDYKSIGTLVEFGRSTKSSALKYVIIPDKFTGHENGKMYGLHPFIAENASAMFETPEECLKFLRAHLPVLSGLQPHYKG